MLTLRLLFAKLYYVGLLVKSYLFDVVFLKPCGAHTHTTGGPSDEVRNRRVSAFLPGQPFWLKAARLCSHVIPSCCDSMAHKQTMATVATTAAQRRTAISVVRGVQLAAHAAAGIVKDLDLEAVRLLRVREGLARVAAGRLEALGREQVVAALGGSGGNVVAVKLPGDSSDTKELFDEKMYKGKGTRKSKRKPRNKRTKAGMKADHADAVAVAAEVGVVMPLDAAALAFFPAQLGFYHRSDGMSGCSCYCVAWSCECCWPSAATAARRSTLWFKIASWRRGVAARPGPHRLDREPRVSS